MTEIRRSALVNYTSEQMFDLVNDVEAYPKRFAWCVGADVASHDSNAMTARLDLRFAGMHQSFSTHNTLQRPDRIDMHLVGGPLRSLDGVWTFTSCGQNGCKIALDLSFEVANKLLGTALQLGLRSLADRMVDDFCAEAKRAYG